MIPISTEPLPQNGNALFWFIISEPEAYWSPRYPASKTLSNPVKQSASFCSETLTLILLTLPISSRFGFCTTRPKTVGGWGFILACQPTSQRAKVEWLIFTLLRVKEIELSPNLLAWFQTTRLRKHAAAHAAGIDIRCRLTPGKKKPLVVLRLSELVWLNCWHQRARFFCFCL